MSTRASKKSSIVNLYVRTKYLKTKTKSYQENISTTFHNNKILKESSKVVCLLVVLIESVFRIAGNYYSQVFLEEWKCVVKEKMMPMHITDDR